MFVTNITHCHFFTLGSNSYFRSRSEWEAACYIDKESDPPWLKEEYINKETGI